MSLTHKVVLMVLFFTTANVAIGFGIHRALVGPEFATLEQSEAVQDMQRVEQAIERESLTLSETVGDWAAWDDTYEFVETRDPYYVEINLSASSFNAVGVDCMLLLDTDARILAGWVLDRQLGEVIEVPELSQAAWSPSHPLLSGEDQWEPVSGILSTSRGPMLMVSRYIFDSHGVKSTRGHFVMGRFLDRKFMAELGRLTRIDLDAWAADDAPPSVRQALMAPQADRFVSVVDEDESRLKVSMLLADFYGAPAFIVTANLPRNITHRAESISRLTFLFLLVQGGVLALGMMMLLNRAVLAPLASLSRSLHAVRRTNDLSIRMGTQRGDEIGEVGREFDAMLGQLEEQIRERRRGEKALRRSEERLLEAQRVAQVGSWELDIASGELWWSDELYRIHDLDPAGPTPSFSEFVDFIHPEDRAQVQSNYQTLLRDGAKRVESELRVITASGALRYHEVIWNIEEDDTGTPQRILGIVSDVTERHRAEESVRRAAAVFRTATEAIAVAGPDGRIIDVNDAFAKITGYEPSEAIGESYELLDSGRHDAAFIEGILAAVNRDGQWEGEIWIRHKHGKAIPAWVSMGRTLENGGNIEQFVFVFNDMTERKQSEELIVRQANYDMLSGIPNRTLFADRLARETLTASREGTTLALLFIDLDDFKRVNDTFGHAAGDEVLKEAAVRIRDCIREVDTVARLGGDEFAVIAPELADPSDAELIAHRIVEALALPCELNECEVVTRASIGITLFPRDAQNDQALLRKADIAMYRSKELGGNTFRFFTSEMNESVARRVQVEAKLHTALERGEFSLHYQPIVALPDGRLVGVEALLRWENDELGSVSPAEFIPLAERKGLITAMGAWVLKTACRQVKAWQENGLPGLRLAVNLSSYEMSHGDPEATTAAALADSGLDPVCLELELTESMLIEDVERTAEIFKNLRALGIRLSIDDFGTGYSSLSYLRNFPFDVLKIDRAFVADAWNHPGGISLLRAIAAMADSLGLEVIVEGVETAEQCELVCSLGAVFSQGHYFSHPLPAEDFEALVEYAGTLPKPDSE